MGPTKAYILHTHLRHNLALIRRAVSPAKVMAVVKANAYGHGSVETARTMLENGADYLGVAFAEEGIELRRAGITAPILVFGAQLEEFFEDHLQHDLELTLSRLEQIEALKHTCRRLHKKARVHIKIDTGMGRVGFMANGDLTPVFQLLSDEWIEVAGVYSHLSSADEDDLSSAKDQIEQFKMVRGEFQKRTKAKILFHIANSATIMRLPEAYFDMVRPGIMLYGNPPGPDFNLTWDLKEAMRFVSKVAAVKTLPPNHPVSYNRRFYTTETTQIAVIPAGYADGYNRMLTNRGDVLIRGKRYPVVGTVCMDQFLVNLGTESPVKIGDEVVLFGQQEQARISIREISQKLKTIPYEVTCRISARVPRVHLKE